MKKYFKDAWDDYGLATALYVTFVLPFRAPRCAHGVKHDGPECRQCSW